MRHAEIIESSLSSCRDNHDAMRVGESVLPAAYFYYIISTVKQNRQVYRKDNKDVKRVACGASATIYHERSRCKANNTHVTL